MTKDELAVTLFREQGFLVMSSDQPLAIGELVLSRPHGTTVPMRIVGLATKDQFLTQTALAHRLCDELADFPNETAIDPSDQYYLVEAAD